MPFSGGASKTNAIQTFLRKLNRTKCTPLINPKCSCYRASAEKKEIVRLPLMRQKFFFLFYYRLLNFVKAVGWDPSVQPIGSSSSLSSTQVGYPGSTCLPVSHILNCLHKVSTESEGEKEGRES